MCSLRYSEDRNDPLLIAPCAGWVPSQNPSYACLFELDMSAQAREEAAQHVTSCVRFDAPLPYR